MFGLYVLTVEVSFFFFFPSHSHHFVLKPEIILKKDNVMVLGISMEGDDELLAEIEVKVAPTRDEWMTTLPPERKVRPLDNLIPSLWL